MIKNNTWWWITRNFYPKGFTLIELLVVVLIIGILAAVAVPQYQKAVEKARLAEALQNLASIQKAVDIIYLENPNFQGAVVGCKDEEDGKCGVLDVDIESALICDQNNGGVCRSKNFAYYAHSLNEINAQRVPNGDYDNEDSIYELYLVRGEDGQWTKYCNWDYNEVYAQSLCDGLETHGWISQEW